MHEVSTFTEKDHHIQTLEREFETTLRVLKAYPEDKLDLKPSQISRTARELIFTFFMEQVLTEKVLSPNPQYGTKPPEAPRTLNELISIYENKFRENLKKLKELPESEFNAATKWFAKPGVLSDMRRIDVLEIFLFDMVHHRGQLSVYLRIAGGILPSVYGPTYETTTNK